jgi:hypothetical protein
VICRHPDEHRPILGIDSTRAMDASMDRILVFTTTSSDSSFLAAPSLDMAGAADALLWSASAIAVPAGSMRGQRMALSVTTPQTL